MEQENTLTPSQLCQLGVSCYFDSESDEEQKRQAVDMILEAFRRGDVEAKYYVARFILLGRVKTSAKDPTEHALTLLYDAANHGCVQARVFLNRYCQIRYSTKFNFRKTKKKGGRLTDFQGKPIRIKRKGLFTPVDAVLEMRDGVNVLSLSANISFIGYNEISDEKGYEKAVLDGMRAWQGEYEVFGGQKLRVEVNLTSIPRLHDSVFVIAGTQSYDSMSQRILEIIGSKKAKDAINDTIVHKRSFALGGLRWTTHSMKTIVMKSKNGRFDDYEDIMHVAKHEFGHVLGLGDLYEEAEKGMTGVERGKYGELDSFAICGKTYNLVMCDHRGPISNNDIEMVVLAFRDNKLQRFQSSNEKKFKISSALGKGN